MSGWGKLGWVLPKDGEPPILATVLGGASDGVDHWSQTLLNDPPTPTTTAQDIGRGPRFFRLQTPLDPPIQMDDASSGGQAALEGAAKTLIRDNQAELSEIATRLLNAGPLPPDPPWTSLQG